MCNWPGSQSVDVDVPAATADADACESAPKSPKSIASKSSSSSLSSSTSSGESEDKATMSSPGHCQAESAFKTVERDDDDTFLPSAHEIEGARGRIELPPVLIVVGSGRSCCWPLTILQLAARKSRLPTSHCQPTETNVTETKPNHSRQWFVVCGK